ncbi:MAG: hypothetical protein DRP89_04615 [Candidatus Neomarinimicrobiota bacterium]|nr:MAG: hypothetical protein DRP89_04615 [Candidatus Neomarinimicrobiota bacterium]
MAPFNKKLLLVSFLIVSFFTQLTATNYYVRKRNIANLWYIYVCSDTTLNDNFNLLHPLNIDVFL